VWGELPISELNSVKLSSVHKQSYQRIVVISNFKILSIVCLNLNLNKILANKS